ncbi:MAG: 2OG-Fe(II) oxygenase [Alphaproteobacteria bacterium]|nr:2OG-Fe(II) oxygenase [Alphaproteobacteria bacterium]
MNDTAAINRLDLDADVAALAARIRSLEEVATPFSHAVGDDLLPPALFEAVMATVPEPEAMVRKSAGHRGRYPDERRIVALTEPVHPMAENDPVLRHLAAVLSARPVAEAWLWLFRRIIGKRIAVTSGMRPEDLRVRTAIELIVDVEGYALPPHTDGAVKLVTVLIYLARPGDPEALGTALYRPLKPGFHSDGVDYVPFETMEEAARVPYRANRCLAFARSNVSFHGVPKNLSGTSRRLLQISIVQEID